MLYNGGVALDKGIAEVNSNYSDDFWEILPIERMQPKPEPSKADEKKQHLKIQILSAQKTKQLKPFKSVL